MPNLRRPRRLGRGGAGSAPLAKRPGRLPDRGPWRGLLPLCAVLLALARSASAAPAEPPATSGAPSAAPSEPSAAPSEPSAAPSDPPTAPAAPPAAPSDPPAAPSDPPAVPSEPSAAPSEPAQADKDRARNLMNEGYRLYKRGDYLSALQAFQAADAIMGVPTTSLYVAKTQEKRGMLLEAVDALVRAQSYPQAPDEPAAFQRAREQAEALEAEILQRIPTLEIALPLLPAGTTVQVALNGTELAPERVHLPRRLNPGVHRVVVSASGYVPHDQRLVLSEREHQRLEVKLEPVPKALPAPLPRPAPAPAGTSEEPAAIPPVAWAAFGVGAAGLVVGTVAGGVAVSQKAALEGRCSELDCPDEARADHDRMLTTSHVSTAGLCVAGVGVATGLILVLASDPEPQPEPAAATIQPLLGLGTAGLSGRF